VGQNSVITVGQFLVVISKIALFILEKYYIKVDNAPKELGKALNQFAIIFKEGMP